MRSHQISTLLATSPLRQKAKFIGEYPCDSNGNPLEVLRHNTAPLDLGDGFVAQHSFSRKPLSEKYDDYHQKITAYNALLAKGGTGSYVLDLVAKTPVKKIHIFDADRFLTHNAFRAPGAPAIEALREQQLKVEYFASIYGRMHRGIVPHPTHIDAKNVDDLNGMSFVFLCMEGGIAKRAIVDKLEAMGVPFVDVGMGLYAKRNSLGGTLRSVISMPDARGPARARISFAADDENNEYDKNIQVADLNALNACLAVISWKKSRAFYFDLGKERFVSYRIANSLLAKGDVR